MVVEMNVCNEWYIYLFFNFFKCFSCFYCGYRYLNDFFIYCNNMVYLIDGCCYISGLCICYRLNSNGSVIINGDVIYINMCRFFVFNRVFCKYLIIYKGSVKWVVLLFWYEEILIDLLLIDMCILFGVLSVILIGGMFWIFIICFFSFIL